MMVALPVCGAQAQSFGVAGYEQVTVTQSIPIFAPTTLVAVCPAGKQVVGGGFSLQDPDDVEILASFPGNAAGALATDRWNVTVRNRSDLIHTVRVTANCVVGARPGYELKTGTATVPGGSPFAVAAVRCTAGNKVLSGGFRVTEATPPDPAGTLQFFHSFPADGSSNRIDDGWDVAVRNPGTTAATVLVVAVCVSGNVAGYEQVDDTLGPLGAGATVLVGANCTAGGVKRVTGGAWGLETPTVVRLITSEPRDGAGPDLDGWSSLMRNTGTSNRNGDVVAICVDADNVAPNTTIIAGPASRTNDTTPTFSFTSTETGSTFRCRFDTALFTACTSPFTAATALGEGSHTFEVIATDPAGNVDGSAAMQGFTVDLTPPDTGITTGPAGPTNDTTPTFEFTSTEAATFQCRFDTGTRAHVRGRRDRHRRQCRRVRGDAQLHGRRDAAEHDHQQRPCRPDERQHANVRVHVVRGRVVVPVPRRHRGAGNLHVAVHDHRAARGSAHVRGDRDGRGWQRRRLRSDAELHRRRDRPRHDDQRRPDRPDERQHAELHLHVVRDGDVPMPRRHRDAGTVHVAVHERTAGRGRAHL